MICTTSLPKYLPGAPLFLWSFPPIFKICKCEPKTLCSMPASLWLDISIICSNFLHSLLLECCLHSYESKVFIVVRQKWFPIKSRICDNFIENKNRTWVRNLIYICAGHVGGSFIMRKHFISISVSCSKMLVLELSKCWKLVTCLSCPWNTRANCFCWVLHCILNEFGSPMVSLLCSSFFSPKSVKWV